MQFLLNLKPSRRSQPVIRIERRDVANGTSLLLENSLATPRLFIEGIRIRRWFQRIEIQRKSVRLLIAVALLFNVIRLEVAIMRGYLKTAAEEVPD